VKRFLQDNVKLVIVAVVCLSFGMAAPAVAARTVAFATNAHKVDGKHAVSSAATVDARKGKLVATSFRTGRLPGNIVDTVPNSLKLGGKPAISYIHDVTVVNGAPVTIVGTAGATQFGTASVTCPTGIVLSGNYKQIDGQPSVDVYRTAISADGRTFSADGKNVSGVANRTFSVFAVCAG
jgi:hypothetical protein